MNKKEEESFLIVIVIVLAFLWVYIINPMIQWVQENLLLVQVTIILIIASGGGFLFYQNRNEQKKEEERKAQSKIDKAKRLALEKTRAEERERFVESQKQKGLVSFTDRNGVEHWGSTSEIEKSIANDNEARVKETLLYKVTESIRTFEPSRVYKNEFGYHTELQGWLKHEFTSASFEKRTGASRPDIAIDDIAIEIKGPTGNRELGTLP